MKDKIAKKILKMEIDKLMQEPESVRDWELITALEIAIEALDTDTQSQGEWIPVSEGLPEEHGYYLVTTDGSHNAVIDIAEYGKFYRKPENEYILGWNKASRVIAWQPLPEPYKKGGAENEC